MAYGISLYNGGAEFPMNSFDYDLIGRMKTKYIQPSAAQIGSTQQTGLWGNGSTWQGGSPPNLQTLAVINTGHTVNIPDNANYEAASLMNNGTLAMGTGSVLTLGSMQAVSRIALQTIDYSYNIRSQLRGINLDAAGNLQNSPEKLFSYKLDYHEDGRYYDGNISRQSWKTNQSADVRGYTYTYDRSNRLNIANYNGVGNENCSVSTSYDLKGNITSLQRYSKTGANSWGLVDNLTYGYINNGSKLQKVDDGVSGNIQANDFRDVTGNDYDYTPAGKLTKDTNKGIIDIKYNYLDLVKEITFSDKVVEYSYNTAGKKIRAKITKNGNTYYTRYNGEILYSYVGNAESIGNYTISEIKNSEGRLVNNRLEFGYTDHVGNLRVSFIDSLGSGFITQSQSYDPWSNVNAGSEYTFNGINTDRFLVSGREQDNETGNVLLDWRNYDSVLGRMNSYDPEDPSVMLSGYAYAGNNPVSMVDPDGREPITIGTAILIGALIGAGTNTATQVIQNKGFNNWNWKSFGLSTLAGGVSGAASFGIGSAFQGVSGFEKIIGSAYAHGFSGMAQSAIFGGDPIAGFASGAFGSLAGSAMGDNPSALLSGLGGGVSGAFGAYITGGKVGQGFAMGASVGLLNHWAHGNPEKSRLKKLYNSLKEDAEFMKDFTGGFKDFVEVYYEMRDANWVNSDKYFHSKANFKATLRGPGGEYAAEKLSNLREFFDQRWPKNDPISASIADQVANRYGREQAKFYKQFMIKSLYPVTIPQFRPKNLPAKY